MDNLYFGQKTNNEEIVRNFDYETLKNKIEEIKPSDGNNGDSAYKVATYHGYRNTVKEWLKTLKGTDASLVTLEDVTSNSGIRLDVLHKNTDEKGIRTWDITATTTANELVNFIPLPCTRVTPNVQIFGGTATISYNKKVDSGKLTLNLVEHPEGTQYFTTDKLLDDYGTFSSTRSNNYIMLETFDKKSFSNLIEHEACVRIVSNLTEIFENISKIKYKLTKNEFELTKSDLDKLISIDNSGKVSYGEYAYLHFISITNVLRENGGSALAYIPNKPFTGTDSKILQTPDFVSVLAKFKIETEELK